MAGEVSFIFFIKGQIGIKIRVCKLVLVFVTFQKNFVYSNKRYIEVITK